MKDRLTRSLGAPGSVRHSLTLLCAIAATAELLLAAVDGLVGAATGLALITVVGLAIVRYAGGAGAQDSGFRKQVRLLGSRAPALGEWHRIVRKTLQERDPVHFATTVRPQLQRLFAARLAERHGTDLYRAPERARLLVGVDLWPWLDPAAPPPGPTAPEPVLRALLDRLEALDGPSRTVAGTPPATASTSEEPT